MARPVLFTAVTITALVGCSEGTDSARDASETMPDADTASGDDSGRSDASTGDDAGHDASSDASSGYELGYEDDRFQTLFVDVDEWRDDPVRHRYVHGGFEGTETRFSMYFPPEDKYQGRFFHYIVPVPGNEHSVEHPEYADPSYSIGFAVDSGAYLVESNEGVLSFSPTADPEVTLWAASAAVAEHSRVLANQYFPDFGPHRPYGYAWGGSGGAFKTIAGIENAEGVWDGVVPFIHASPVALPNNFTVQAHAMRVLRDKLPAIVDAVDPGGSGDMYAGLNDQERAALTEVTKFGFPPDAWFNYEAIAFGYTGVLATLLPAVLTLDASYVDDFWSEPGYFGADHPEALESYRIHHETAIAKLLLPEEVRDMGLPLSLSATQPANADVPAAMIMEDLPAGDLQGASVTLKSGGGQGTTAYVAGVFDDLVVLGYGQGGQLSHAAVGDQVEIDNRVYLAIQTYHRHQVPSADYPVYDQYRGEDGEPLYPQRTVQTTALFNQAGEMSGKFAGKMIVVENLMDEIAFPWHADWYRSRVKAQLGDAFKDNYRLWYVEKAMHTPPSETDDSLRPAITTRAVDFGPVLQQALRDVAAWVEKGTPPPASTPYEITDGQVAIPETASKRKGVQPVVTMTANGEPRADVAVGEEVSFTAKVTVPPDAGSVVGIEWDFEGTGKFPHVEVLDDTRRDALTAETSFTFTEPGTYFPAVRASVHRDGDPDTPYARVQNLGRVRVVVQ